MEKLTLVEIILIGIVALQLLFSLTKLIIALLFQKPSYDIIIKEEDDNTISLTIYKNGKIFRKEHCIHGLDSQYEIDVLKDYIRDEAEEIIGKGYRK